MNLDDDDFKSLKFEVVWYKHHNRKLCGLYNKGCTENLLPSKNFTLSFKLKMLIFFFFKNVDQAIFKLAPEVCHAFATFTNSHTSINFRFERAFFFCF